MTNENLGRFPLDADLTPLVAALKEQGIMHRITEMKGEQCLLIADNANQERVVSILKAFATGDLRNDETESLRSHETKSLRPTKGLIISPSKSPVTFVMISLGVMGTLATQLPWEWLYALLLFASDPMAHHPSSLLRGFTLPWESQQWWRVLSPAFLHYSWVHIAFNGIALLQIGLVIERLWGWRYYLILCVTIGVLSNVIQYWETPSPFFGGLSGIVFGLFAFNGVAQRLIPEKSIKLPKGFYGLLVVWLGIGFTPILEWLFGIHMANGAHLGGALMGAGFAVFYRLFVQHYKQH